MSSSFTREASYEGFWLKDIAPRARASLAVAFAATALVAVTRPVAAGDDDDTLRFYLSKSSLVVVGEFVSEPFGWVGEVGVISWSAEFRIGEVLKGERPSKETIKVGVVRYDLGSLVEQNEAGRAEQAMGERDRPAELKLGGKSILFLDARGRTSDMWFGVQPPYPSMIRTLKRLAAEQSPAK